MIKLVNIIMEIVFSLITELFQTASDFAVSAVPLRKGTPYNAEFGRPEAQLLKSGSGFWIGNLCTSQQEANSHLMCLVGSGSRKSTSICFPTLLMAHNSSYVVHDPSRELYNGTAQYLSSKGYRIFVLDYDNTTNSSKFNVLQKCTGETDVYRVANVLTRNTYTGSNYDYWAQSADEIIGLFSYIIFKYAAPDVVNLGSVAIMVETFSHSPELIDLWLVNHKVDKKILSKYKALVATPEKTLQSSLSTAKNILAIYNLDSFARITSSDNIDFSLFRREKCILFICGSPTTATLCKGITASFFDSFFSFILKKLPEPGSIGITFMIDEAGIFSIASLPQILALGRKYNVSIATLWQDYNQIENLYNKNDAANIFANSKFKVFMPSGQPLVTCQMLSQLLGKYNWIDENGHEKTRELLGVQEIFQLKKILVLNGNNKPLLLAPAPFFENKKLLALTKSPIYEFKEESSNENYIIEFD